MDEQFLDKNGKPLVGAALEARKEKLARQKALADSVNEKVVKKDKPKTDSSPTSEKSDVSNLTKILGIFGANMMSMHLFARDTNVARQNTQKLVKLAGGDPTNKADRFFLKQSELEKKLEVERDKQKPSAEPKEEPTDEDKGNKVLSKILSLFGLGNLAKIFSLSKFVGLLRFIGPIFLITTIVSGIYKGWEAWKETGSLLEAVKAGLVEFLDFVTLGLFGKEQIAKLFDQAVEFVSPVVEAMGTFLGSIGDFFKDKWEKFKAFFGYTKVQKEYDAHEDEEIEQYKDASQRERLRAEVDQLRAKRDKLREEVDKKEKALAEIRKTEAEEKAAKYSGDDEVVRARMGLKGPSAKQQAQQALTPTAVPINKDDASPKQEAPGAASAGGQPSEPTGGEPGKGTGSLKSLVTTQSGVDIDHFKPELEEPLTRMASAYKEQTGKPLLVTSGYRSNEKQKELWDAALAKNGGDVAATRKKVAPPAAPLGPGKGSMHLQGLAIDINSKGDGGINKLAGSRDAPTGWLEKFGLIRPVPGEDWHIQLAKTPAVADGKNVPNSDGKVASLDKGKNDTGEKVSKSSQEVAANQRAEEKRATPTVVNAGVTNNSKKVHNEYQVKAA